ncbi:MAG: PAS domain S-box protein, partial [Desulfobacterales bacterium]|nr:PAS domain S-box protein [Desulfobacterales bacterium]
MAEANQNNRGDEPELSENISHREMTAILSRSPVGICITKNRYILWANPRFYEITGHPDGSLTGQNARILYPTDREYDRVGDKLGSDIKGPGTAVIDTRLSKRDGTAFDSRLRATYLDPAEPDRGILVMVSDITDINSRATQDQQAHKMEAIGTLAGRISHDFNNLLMGIQGHLSLMRISIDTPDRLEGHISQVKRLVDTAADLTSRLLGFARGGKYQITTLDINQVLSMALEIIKPTRKDIRVDTAFSPATLSVDGDNSQMEQVFLNILTNASQAMVDAGTLTVITRRIEIPEDHRFPFQVSPGAYVEITIRDTGIGMDEA